MKVSTFIIIVLLCVIAYTLGTRNSTHAPASADSAATPKPVASKPAPPAPPVVKVPQAVKDMMAANPALPAEEIQRRFEEKMKSATRWELHGRVLKHLSSGHVALMGFACKPGDRTVPRDTNISYALWGFPGADKIAEEEQIDCLCVPMYWVQSGSVKLIEMIYVDPGTTIVPKRRLYD